jgi:ATP-dependent Clp protease ATP-binding subunit ClpA
MPLMSVSECLSYCQRNRWSDSAMHVIDIADALVQLVQRSRDEPVATEHLLWALVAEPNPAYALLEEHHPSAIREIVDEISELIGPIPAQTAPLHQTNLAGRIEPIWNRDRAQSNRLLAPRSVKVLELATTLASTTLNWSSGEVSCEHLLFALIYEPECVACVILWNSQIRYDVLLTLARRKH